MKAYTKLGKKFFVGVLFGLIFASIPLNQTTKVEEEGYFMPAYSYVDDYSIEPKYKDGIVTSYGTFTQKVTTYDRMNVSSTWNSFRGEHIKVAVIDTGCNTNYEDFDGTIISPRSYDVYNKTTNVSDSNGHGTDSAACIAAAINGVGGLGISPNVELHIYKAVNSGGGFPNSALQNALRRAIDDHVDIINMSLQGYTSSFSYSYVEDLNGQTYSGTMSAASLNKSTLQSLIDEAYNAGITVVAAVGNYNTTTTCYPAANDHVIGVGSTGLNDANAKAGYSNTGSYVDLVAPGYVVVPSTSDKAYRLYYGTSFSAPLVTGAIALYKSKYPSATPAQIEAKLLATCDSLSFTGSGAGKINVANFLNDGQAEDWVATTGIELPLAESISVGGEKTLIPTFSPSNASRQSCYWSTSDSSILTVDCHGKIKGIKAGTAIITATSVDGEYTDTCSVTVGSYVPVSSITLNKHELSLKVGESDDLNATILPDNATEKEYIFISNDEDIATVSDDGHVVAISKGETTITVLCEDMEHEDTCTVKVSDDRKWYWVKDTSDLIPGDKYIIARSSVGKTIGPLSSSSLTAITSTFSSDGETITSVGTNTIEFTLGINGDYYTLANGSNLLGSGAVKSLSFSSGITDWNISFDGDGYATIQNATSSNGRIIYNTNNESPKITTYTSNVSNTMLLPQLYRYGSQTPKVLDSISVSNQKTEYTVGDSFVKPTVTANYIGGGTKDVSSLATFSGYDLSQTGNQTVNVSYTENSVTKNTSYSITVSPQPVVLDSISVKTNPSKLEYEVGEYFNPTGLVITKHMSDGSSSDVNYADETSNFSFNPSLSTKLSTSHTSVSITYMEKSTSLFISVSQGEMAKGNMTISKTSFSSISGDLDSNISYSSSQGNGTSKPQIYNNGIRLYQGSSGKYGGFVTISAKNNCLIKSISFSVTGTYATSYAHGTSTSNLGASISISKSGEAVISPVDNESYVIANMGQSSSARLEIYSITVNYYSPLKAAQDWSNTFISDLHCDSTGKTEPLVSEWYTLATSYGLLDNNAKSYFTSSTISDTKILEAVNKYDYVITKYGTSKYLNFMSRDINHSMINNNLIKIDDSNILAVIIVAAFVPVSLLLGYVVIKKRHKEND